MISTSLSSSDVLTQELNNSGIYSWEDVLIYVKNIPYGRNANREDLSLVLKENKGTCSFTGVLSAGAHFLVLRTGLADGCWGEFCRPPLKEATHGFF